MPITLSIPATATTIFTLITIELTPINVTSMNKLAHMPKKRATIGMGEVRLHQKHLIRNTTIAGHI